MALDPTKMDRVFTEEDEYYYSSVDSAEYIQELLECETLNSWWEDLPL